MSRIFRDSSVLNQFGSPCINSNTFANRPAFGQPGRLFVSTDTLAIFRDTGSAWDNLTDNPGNIGTLQEVTTNGNTSNNNLLITARENIFTKTFNSTDVSGDTTYILNIGSNINLDNSNLGLWNIHSYAYKSILQNVTEEADSRIDNIFLENVITNDTLSSKSITVNQGSYINTVSAFRILNQFNSSSPLNISHFASIIIEPLILTNSTITNYYGLLINNSTGSTITNRWGIYQNGANDVNYFAGTITGNRVEMQITIASAGYIEGANYKPSGINNFNFIGTDYVTRLATIFNSSGNLRIGNGTTDSTRKLQVQGEAEFITTVNTGIHTSSANYLPIWVNGVQYYLDLLN